MPARRDTRFYDLPGRQTGEIPLRHSASGFEKWQTTGRPMTLDEYRALNQPKDESMNYVNPNTGPAVVPANGHIPAGWVSPAEHDAAQRAALALELAQEQEAADRADREAAIDARMAERRSAGAVPAEAAEAVDGR